MSVFPVGTPQSLALASAGDPAAGAPGDSWDNSLLQLSIGLSQICASPVSPVPNPLAAYVKEQQDGCGGEGHTTSSPINIVTRATVAPDNGNSPAAADVWDCNSNTGAGVTSPVSSPLVTPPALASTPTQRPWGGPRVLIPGPGSVFTSVAPSSSASSSSPSPLVGSYSPATGSMNERLNHSLDERPAFRTAMSVQMPPSHPGDDRAFSPDTTSPGGMGGGPGGAVFVDEHGTTCRRLRVRHIETQHKLHDQLAEISGLSKYRSARETVRRRHLSGRGGDFSLDVTGHVVTDLYAELTTTATAEEEDAADTDQLTTVCIHSVSEGGAEVGSVDLTTDQVEHRERLIAVVRDDTLQIRLSKFPSQGLLLDQVPLFHIDERRLLWQVCYHLTGAFAADSLAVHTLDDQLIIRWEGASPWQTQLYIPDTVVTRTVAAAVTAHDQLVITGGLRQGRERRLTL